MMFDHPYICLEIKGTLDDTALMEWIKTVSKAGPRDVMESTALSGQPGFYRRREDGKNRYVARLTRNLSVGEAKVIAESFGGAYPDGDFEISWSQSPIKDDRTKDLSHDLMKGIALAAAKHNHNHWLRKRVDEGWRLGDRHDGRQKISPMCRDWDQLPESYKRHEYQRMVSLMEILDKMNLRLINK